MGKVNEMTSNRSTQVRW